MVASFWLYAQHNSTGNGRRLISYSTQLACCIGESGGGDSDRKFYVWTAVQNPFVSSCKTSLITSHVPGSTTSRSFSKGRSDCMNNTDTQQLSMITSQDTLSDLRAPNRKCRINQIDTYIQEPCQAEGGQLARRIETGTNADKPKERLERFHLPHLLFTSFQAIDCSNYQT